eukprot:GHVU01179492.1.p1 GENE.GHVU01179492.1~~GHVU01179492.1.p1  ORF type:complete len:142 (+),score=26.57 GHVU01179492.1:327-752(+)
MRVIAANHMQSGDSNGRIDAAEFLGRFRVVYGNTVKEKMSADPWVHEVLAAIGRAIMQDKESAAELHYEAQEVQNYARGAKDRRRSSTVRAVALFQKFKEFKQGKEDDGGFPVLSLCNARCHSLTRSFTSPGRETDRKTVS